MHQKLFLVMHGGKIDSAVLKVCLGLLVVVVVAYTIQHDAVSFNKSYFPDYVLCNALAQSLELLI